MDIENGKTNSLNIQNQNPEGSFNSSEGSATFSIDDLAAHDETKLIKAEWEEIKDLANGIDIKENQIDVVSTLIGVIIPILISLVYEAIKYFGSKANNLNDLLFYGIIALLFLIGSFIYFAFFNNKEKNNLSQAKFNSDRLKDKIKKIDNRTNTR